MNAALRLPDAGPLDDFRRGEAVLARGGHYWRRPLRLLLTERTSLRWLLLGALAESLIGLATPWLSAMVIDDALPNGAPRMLAIVVFMTVVATLNVAWIGWLRARIMIVLSCRIEAVCLGWVLERFLRTPFARTQHSTFGDTNETMGAVSGTTVSVVQAAVGITSRALGVVATLVLLSIWFPALAAAVTATAALMAALASVYAVREGNLARATLETSSRQQQTFHVLLRAVATLRVSGATDRFSQLWKGQMVKQTSAAISQQLAAVSRGVVFGGVPQLAGLMALAWLVHRVMGDEATLGELMMGIGLVGNAMAGCVGLASTAVGFRAMRPHFQRIDRLLAASQEDDAPREPIRAELAMDRGLVLDGVYFRYGEGDRWVLEDMSRRFAANEVTTIRAASGAGKTTTLRLLAGLVPPERGSVRVLGRDPREDRDLVTYLPQKSTLLEASIATNLQVLSGRPLNEALAVAEHTGLSRLLEKLPMGADTLVSIAGSNLSAGQSQLILLTAAFASARPVILLDEATSQLDAATESQVDWAALIRDRTVVRVLHD